MGEIQVVPPSLQSTARQVAAGADDTRSVAASVDGAAGAAGATGHPAAAGAYERMCAVWSAELARTGDALDSLAGLLTVAGLLYQATDQQAMPEGG